MSSRAATWPPALLGQVMARQAPQRLMVVSATVAMMGLLTTGLERMLPVYATRTLGISPGAWAHTQTLRMVGATVGVVILGGLADRFGQRRVGVWTLLGMAVLLGLIGYSNRFTLFLIMPLYGAMFSTLMVVLNTLTQEISERRQGLVNSIYRAVGSGVGLLSPLLVASLALWWGGYRLIFLAGVACLAGAAWILSHYPGEPTALPAGPLRVEVLAMWERYRSAWRQSPLLRYLLLSVSWGSIWGGAYTFIALRFTMQLGQSDQEFGALCSLAGGAALLETAILGLVLDRLSLRTVHLLLVPLCGLSTLLIGWGNSLPLAAAAYIVGGQLPIALASATCIWVYRACGDATPGAAFALSKTVGTVAMTVSTLVCGFVEPVVGMQAVFVYGGLSIVLLGIMHFFLAEPPRTPRVYAGP